jgi:hypothetical protein
VGSRYLSWFEPVALQDAVDGGAGHGYQGGDLGVAFALAAQGDDAGFDFRASLPGLADRHEGAGIQSQGSSPCSVIQRTFCARPMAERGALPCMLSVGDGGRFVVHTPTLIHALYLRRVER